MFHDNWLKFKKNGEKKIKLFKKTERNNKRLGYIWITS